MQQEYVFRVFLIESMHLKGQEKYSYKCELL